MFGSRRRKVSDAITRSFKAIFTGGFYHLERAQEHGLNDKAEAWLYSEAVVHLAYVVSAFYGNIFRRRFRWATTKLFGDAVLKACAEEEQQGGAEPMFEGGLAMFLFQRLDKIEALTKDERAAGKHYLLSAQSVAELDPSADIERIVTELKAAAINFGEELMPRLEALAE